MSGSHSREVVKRKVEKNGRNLHPEALATAESLCDADRGGVGPVAHHNRAIICSPKPLNGLLNLQASSVGELEEKREIAQARDCLACRESSLALPV